ncbi:MAG: hypothetical protein ACREN8_09990 [Candidatus Dormibacteraceae bacterium]
MTPEELEFTSPNVRLEWLKLRKMTVGRREFLGSNLILAGSLGITATVPAMADLTGEVLKSRLLEGLRNTTASYIHLVETIPPRQLLSMLVPHLEQLQNLSAVTGNRTVIDLTAQTASLAGWVTHDLGNRGDAETYWQHAIKWAQEAGSGETEAYALVAMSGLTSARSAGSSSNPQMSIALLDRAAVVAGANAKPQLRAYVMARRSQEHAALRRGKEARLDAAAAEDIYATGHPSDLLLLERWGTGELLRYTGGTALMLGDSAPAITKLEGALGQLDRDSYLPPRVRILTYLGGAYGTRGDVDYAVDHLERALSAAKSINLVPAREWIGKSRSSLAAWNGLPQVRQLDEHLMEL